MARDLRFYCHSGLGLDLTSHIAPSVSSAALVGEAKGAERQLIVVFVDKVTLYSCQFVHIFSHLQI